MLAEPRPPPGPRPNETPAAPAAGVSASVTQLDDPWRTRIKRPKTITAAGRALPPYQFRQEETDLDEVDLGRKIRRDFEADFLLADCGLRPGLHGVCPPVDRGNETSPPVH